MTLKRMPINKDMKSDIHLNENSYMILKKMPINKDMKSDTHLNEKVLKESSTKLYNMKPLSNRKLMMDERDLKKLSKSQLIKLLLKQEKKTKVATINGTKPTRLNKPPPPPIPEGAKPFKPKSRPGWVRNPNTNRLIKINGPTYRKLYPMRYELNKMDKTNQEINETSKSIDD